MGSITLTPTQHQVFNMFDRQGLLMALPRLELETNIEYKQRLLDVMVNQANSTYMGLIFGITRELGLSLFDAITIQPVLDGNGDPLVAEPAIITQDSKCILYNNFTEDDILLTIDRFEKNGGAYTMQELVDTINATGIYTATLSSEADADEKSLKIFNQTTIGEVFSEDISNSGNRIRLDFVNLIAGSVTVSSRNLITRVTSSSNLQSGQYFVDLPTGTIISANVPAPGSFVRYQYRIESLTFKASPVILSDLQSEDFRSKMFEQILDGTGNPTNGLPTVMGAEVINELLSVYPYGWGK